jgi:endonuclease/exonuclease/phosphatase family metal-dependent hydrolase
MLCAAAALVLARCAAFSSVEDSKGSAEAPEFFAAAEWNVQALFDGEETGGEYGEYLERSGWNAEKYSARINAVSAAVLQMIKPGTSASSQSSRKPAEVPGLIGLVELENSKVLDDLARGGLSKYGYSWTAFSNIPGSSLGVGFLSRFPFSDVRAHSITAGNDTAPRPVLEVRIKPRGKEIVFLLCHWKSKLGGSATETQRQASARLVRRRLRELKKNEAETPVIVMGDLNENHDEFYRNSGEVLTALLPDDPDAAALSARHGSPENFLVLSGEKPPRSLNFPAETCALYSPWNDGQNTGSYYYRGGWETIDHFLLSDGLFDGTGWDFSSFRALDHAPFTRSNGGPDTYVPRNGRGLSDHLPLLLYLRCY